MLRLAQNAYVSDPRYTNHILRYDGDHIPKEAQHPSNTLYVGSLAYTTPVAELKNYFEQWGPVDEVVLRE